MKRSNDGSIYKTPDGKRWFARIRYTDRDGTAREKKRTCPTHAKAKEALARLRSEIADELSDRKTYRHADIYYRDKYVHAARFAGGKKLSGMRTSLTAINTYLDRALEHFGDLPLDAITYGDLIDYKRCIEELPVHETRTRSIADVNQHLKNLRRVLNVAIGQDWLASNPFKKGQPLIHNSFEVERTRILSPEEESRLLAACTGRREHLVPLIIFAIETACRRGEIQSLRWLDVDLTGRVITIDGTNTKTLKTRMAPITQRLRDVLAQLRQNQLRPNSLVFGKFDYKRSFASACREAKLNDVHFHDLRHTGITRMLEKGISPPLVMKISGHTQERTFMRYVNQNHASILEIALRLDAAA